MTNQPKTYTVTKPPMYQPQVLKPDVSGIVWPYMETYIRRRPMDDVKKASKFLSLVLRHRPGDVDVIPDAQGWVKIADLINGSNGRLTRESIDQAVANNDKQRFALSEDGTKIRALQGHSFPVDLGLESTEPPDILYHGTYPAAVSNILREGLRKMLRQHVHMAAEATTATTVGLRRGAPVIFEIDAKSMAQVGHKFFCSENGVWLTDHVPSNFLKKIN